MQSVNLCQRYQEGNISMDSIKWVIVTDLFLMKLGITNYYCSCINATLTWAFMDGDKGITMEIRSLNSRGSLRHLHFDAEI